MTKVIIALNARPNSYTIERGMYVEIDNVLYICAVASDTEKRVQLINLTNGTAYDDSQPGLWYKFNENKPIRFIENIIITEE